MESERRERTGGRLSFSLERQADHSACGNRSHEPPPRQGLQAKECSGLVRHLYPPGLLSDCILQLVDSYQFRQQNATSIKTETVGVREDFKSGCPINLTLEVLGDRWSLLIIRDMMFGNRRHFRELLTRSEEGIASNILAARLKVLVERGILNKADDPTHK